MGRKILRRNQPLDAGCRQAGAAPLPQHVLAQGFALDEFGRDESDVIGAAERIDRSDGAVSVAKMAAEDARQALHGARHEKRCGQQRLQGDVFAPCEIECAEHRTAFAGPDALFDDVAVAEQRARLQREPCSARKARRRIARVEQGKRAHFLELVQRAFEQAALFGRGGGAQAKFELPSTGIDARLDVFMGRVLGKAEEGDGLVPVHAVHGTST